jgi:hypothetical protein
MIVRRTTDPLCPSARPIANECAGVFRVEELRRVGGGRDDQQAFPTAWRRISATPRQATTQRQHRGRLSQGHPPADDRRPRYLSPSAGAACKPTGRVRNDRLPLADSSPLSIRFRSPSRLNTSEGHVSLWQALLALWP